MLKYIKIFKGTPTYFDLNRSSPRRKVHHVQYIAATTKGLIVRILKFWF